MRKKTFIYFLFIAAGSLLFSHCRKDPPMIPDGNDWVYDPQPYDFSGTNLPLGLPNLIFMENIPADNPVTIEGVHLGRKLFYDPILSFDSSLSCSGCHRQEFAFSDGGKAFSLGIDGILGHRNAMPLFNLGYQPLTSSLDPLDTIGFFWDGRAPTLEDQALRPIQDTIEMHETLPNVLKKLNRSETYQELFYEAFGEDSITSELVSKALAQFERTIVSGNTKYDQAINAVLGVYLTEQELLGSQLFVALDGGDCFHCHVLGGTFTDYTFRNNGLDEASVYTDFTDPGRGRVTGDTGDYGKFKVPSLRNIEYTAPYMHDGRFETLEEVLEHYNEHVVDGPFTDPFMQFAFQGGVQLGEDSIAALVAFLKTLSDPALLTNPDYGPPDY